jgi:hypothetical protein
MEPRIVPASLGVYTTLTVQLSPVGMLVPQVFVSLKSPLAAILLIVTAELVWFVTVTFCAALDVPAGCEGKVSCAVEMVTWPIAFPERLTT